jgi:hypothetical protein
MRMYCETCCREVIAAHRTPEALWLHRVTLALPSLLEGEKMGSWLRSTSVEGEDMSALPDAGD